MKKLSFRQLLSTILAFMLVLGVFAPQIAYANEINVVVDGQRVDFAGQGPLIVDDRMLVPIRGVFEILGFDVDWDGGAQQVTLSRTGDVVIITIDNTTFTANGTTYTMDVPAQIIGGSTMLPIRTVLESVGYHIGWYGATNTVIISTVPFVDGVATAQMRGVRADVIGLPFDAGFGWIDQNGTLRTWVPAGIAEEVIAVAEDVAVISHSGSMAQFGHVLLIMNDGSLWARGGNASGQIGDGTTENRA